MAFSPDSELNHKGQPMRTAGQFTEKEHGNIFEFSVPHPEEAPWPEYPHKVWVTNKSIGGEQGFRWANVLATVAYVVVDEDAEGKPVVERWHIRGKRNYEAP